MPVLGAQAATGDLEQVPLHKIGLIAAGRALCLAAESAADRRGQEVGHPSGLHLRILVPRAEPGSL